jgi:hypothetical protein
MEGATRMTAVTTNLSLAHGDTATLAITVGSLGSTGLAAYTDARFTAKRDVGDADSLAIISKSLGAGVTVTTAGDATTSGVLSVAIAPGDTTMLPSGYASVLTYDVRLYDTLHDAYTVAQGLLTVTPTATQAAS